MPTFTTGLGKYAADGCLVKPLLIQYFQNPERQGAFDVHFEPPSQREPDGWFHASAHPLMNERDLLAYIQHPHLARREEFGYTGKIAVYFGTLMHEVTGRALDQFGITVPLPEGPCVACGLPRPAPGRLRRNGQCGEHGVIDLDTRSRGHMDKILDFKMRGTHGYDFKCLAHGVMVSMADGSLQPAEKISEGDLILGWDEDRGEAVPRRVSKVWDNGIVPVVKIRTRGGRELMVTEEHPFLTKRGWVKASDLVPWSREWKHGKFRSAEHDVIRTAWGSSWHESGYENVEQSRLLGLIVGDGGLTGKSVLISNIDPGVMKFVSSYVAQFGCHVRRISAAYKSPTYGISTPRGSNRNHFLDLLRREDLMGKGAYEKRVPPSVWTSGPAAWAAFLSGYLDADGSVRHDPGSYPLIKWTSVNRELLLECQTLLSYLSIKSSVNRVRGKYKGEEHISFVLWIRDARSVARAKQVLTPVHSLKQLKLAELAPSTKLIRDNLEWDTVYEVSGQLARPTVAIEVEGGTHITAGLVTHNTIYGWGLNKVPDMDVDFFREKWPKYWVQAQEYMRMSGLRRYIVTFMSLGSPWEFREFHLEYDAAHCAQVEARYRRVLAMAAA
jgi:hypothetical protein